MKKLRLFKLDKRNEKYKDWGYRNTHTGKEYYYKREYRFTIENNFDGIFDDDYVPSLEENLDYRIQQSNKQHKLEETLNKLLDK